MVARAWDRRFWLVAALPGVACSLILDFDQKPIDAGVPDAMLPDARLVPEPCEVDELPVNNNVAAQATVVANGANYFAAICGAGDNDYYRITVAAGDVLSFGIVFTHRIGGNLDLFLLDLGLNGIATSASLDDNETIVCPGTGPDCPTLAPGDFYVLVRGQNDQVDDNLYQLQVQIGPPPVDAGVDAM